MKLSDNLRQIRKEHNLSQEQLAEKLGVSRQAVSKWESGQSYPEMDKVLLICKLFNYNIDELMNENVKEVNESKQSKININKYIDDFFGFITKTVDMLSSMRFRDKIKCLLEQIAVCIFLFIIFMMLGIIGSSILSNIFGGASSKIYWFIRNISESIYTILALVIGITVLLHIFKIRYLDYYEIVKVDDEKKENESNNKEEINLKSDKKKVFLEENKEKIIIRDPGHSQSKFLTGIVRIVLWCIKFIATCIAIIFVFSFIGLVTLLILSFLFVKTGLVFVGAVLGLISAIVINFIILEAFYNFIINKKSKKTRMAIMFIIALTIAGISIGLICVGITGFNFVQSTNEIEKVYELEMKDNLSIDVWYSAIEFVETDSDAIKIVVEHSKYYNVDFTCKDNRIEVYCFEENSMEKVRDIIKDINNKEIKDYSIPMTRIYTSKENIKKINEDNTLNLY